MSEFSGILDELREIAREQGVTYAGLRKAELLEVLGGD